MPGCSFTKETGGRCKAQAMRDSQWCYMHNPDLAEERRQNNSRGGRTGGRGRSKASRSAIKELHSLLEDLTQQVIDGELDTSRGAVASQLVNTRIRLFEFERRLHETEELERRLEQLEGLLDQRERSSR